MTDQYVFELQFKGKADGSDYKENQFVIIDGSSMAEFARLKEDLGMCMPEPFAVQYIDDEEDVISIDTEEEFREFAKIAKKRSSRGMLMRLILNSNLPMDHGHVQPPPSSRREVEHLSRLKKIESQNLDPFWAFEFTERGTVRDRDGIRYSGTLPKGWNPSSSSNKQRRHRSHDADSFWFKEKIKAELKKEILSELKQMGPGAGAVAAPADHSDAAEDAAVAADPAAAGGSNKAPTTERIEDDREVFGYEEEVDSDGNTWLIPQKNLKKSKLMHYKLKLEKKEKVIESKIDQRLEKLEMKRKRLMEKYNCHRMLSRKPAPDSRSVPVIISAIVTKESSDCKSIIPTNKPFSHTWTIVNDGTVPLTTVELRHTWSSTGLEPEETCLKLPMLLPGDSCQQIVKFKAPPSWFNNTFISYWHFHRFEEPHWVEFGHYVSLIGTITSLKSSARDSGDVMIFESNKKAKHDGKKAVTFMDEATAERATDATAERASTEEKVLNEESNIMLKKQMERLQATLASSEIAAEMAREAARLLATTAENTARAGQAAAKPSEGEKLNNCNLDEAAAAVQKLNLVDSDDSDATMETNEESDRGFVIVNMADNDRAEHGSGKEAGETAPPSENNTEEAPAQPEPDRAVFPRLDNTMPFSVFPPPPPRVPNPPVYCPQTMIPHNAYNFHVFPPSANTLSHGVFPPPINYSQIPTYPPVPTFSHAPAVTIPLPTQPTFAPVSQPCPQQGQTLGHPFNPFCFRNASGMPNSGEHKIFWTPVGNRTESSVSTVAAKEKPAETKTVKETNAAEAAEANASSEAAPQPEQPQPKQAQTQQPQMLQPQMQMLQPQMQMLQPQMLQPQFLKPQMKHLQAQQEQQQQAQQEQQQQAQQEQQQQAQHEPQQQPQSQQQQMETTSQTGEQKKNGDQVQILPQALVDGAINVAATAYSTAWNALNNLRPKEGEASEFDPVFENNMAMLVEMGFNNLERNARLLKRFNNDISQVIGVICSTGGAHNLEID